MITIILEKVSPSLKGELSKWLIEIATGVFVGNTSALVRDKLWEKCVEKCQNGRVTMAWNSNNEQGFDFKNHNETRFIPIEIEGIKLIMKPSKL